MAKVLLGYVRERTKTIFDIVTTWHMLTSENIDDIEKYSTLCGDSYAGAVEDGYTFAVARNESKYGLKLCKKCSIIFPSLDTRE